MHEHIINLGRLLWNQSATWRPGSPDQVKYSTDSRHISTPPASFESCNNISARQRVVWVLPVYSEMVFHSWWMWLSRLRIIFTFPPSLKQLTQSLPYALKECLFCVYTKHNAAFRGKSFFLFDQPFQWKMVVMSARHKVWASSSTFLQHLWNFQRPLPENETQKLNGVSSHLKRFWEQRIGGNHQNPYRHQHRHEQLQHGCPCSLPVVWSFALYHRANSCLACACIELDGQGSRCMKRINGGRNCWLWSMKYSI